jgi:tetratricopeptide (TPR) repeat protein
MVLEETTKNLEERRMSVRTDAEAQEGILRLRLDWAWLLPLLLVVATLLAFSNSFGREFIWDDVSLVLQNRLVRDPSQAFQLFATDLWGFAQGDGKGHDLYRPLVSLSYMLDLQLWGARPAGFHTTNLLFHVLSSLTVYFILQAMLKDRWLAWLGALLFAVHPIHTESVTWISGRTDVMCGFFLFLSFLLYLYSRQREGWGYLVGSLVAFFLALLCKEMAVTLPAVIVLYALAFSEAPWRGRWREMGQTRLGRAVWDALPYLAVVVLYLAIRWAALGVLFASEERTQGLLGLGAGLGGLVDTLLLSSKVVALYLRLLVLSYPLNALRLVSDVEAASGFLTWLSVGVIVAVLGLGVLAWWRARVVAFGIFFFFIAVLPVSWLFPVGDMVAERFLYIPSLAVCLVAAVFGIWLWRRQRAVATTLLVLLALTWAGLTFARNADWRDGLTFWSKTVAASPRSTVARNHLGLEFYYRQRYDTAIAEFEQALEIDAEDDDAYNNLATVYYAQERYEEAEAAFQQALALAPDQALLHYNLGAVYERLDDPETAIAAYQTALNLDPYLESAHLNLGLLYNRQERWAEAIFMFERLLDIHPDSLEAHNGLGMVYLQLGIYPQAIYEFDQALQIYPLHVEVLNNLGLALLNAEAYEQAIPPLADAVQLAPNFPAAHFNLGLAYKETGQNAQALRELNIVLELEPGNEEAQRLIEELGGE